MTPEQQDLYVDSVILNVLDEHPGLSGDELIRYANGVALVDCEHAAKEENDLIDLEMFIQPMMHRDNIFRRCDVLLESGDIRFDVEQDAWFSVPSPAGQRQAWLDLLLQDDKDAWADVFVDTILQESVGAGLDLTDKKQRETIVMGLMDAIQFLDNECEWPEDLRR